MSVKVKDLLELKLFSSAEVIAGNVGLENEIKRINFSDCPIPDDEIEKKLVLAGDFFIDSLYIVMDDMEKMKNVFEFYVRNRSAGICVINEFVKLIPEEIKDFANKNNFPIIIIDGDVPYAEIIRTTTEMILLEQIDTISEMRIDRLLDPNISKDEIILISSQVNGVFKNLYSVLYIHSEEFKEKNLNSIRLTLSNNYDFEALKYRDGMILILNYDKSFMLNAHLDYIKMIIEMENKEYTIGISNNFSKREEFNFAIRQSLNAYELAPIINKSIVYYKDLNLFKILYPLRHSIYIKEFYDEIFVPLAEYDKYYKSDMLRTLEIYLQNDGDFKKTAQHLHQHENTIRYRILKAKKILDLENDNIKFIEQVSLAIKIDKVINME